MYCGIHVYEKLDGMSAWLLGFIALRELLWHPGDRQCCVGSPGLPDQHRFYRTPEPHDPPACGRGRAAGHHAVQGGGRHAPATGAVPRLSQFLPAACELACTSGYASTDQRHGLCQAMATADTGHGRGADRSRLDAARGAPVSRAAMAPASGGVSTPRWWGTAKGGA